MRVHAPDPRFGGGRHPLCGSFGETTLGPVADVDCRLCLRKLGLAVTAQQALTDAALAWHEAWVRDGSTGDHNLLLCKAVDDYLTATRTRR